MTTRAFIEPKTGRPLVRVAAPDFSAIPEFLAQQPGPFVLFVAADTEREAESDLVATASALLRAGAVAVHCWGPGAARLELAFDLAANRLYSPADPVILTSSRTDHDLEDAMWEGVVATYPAEGLDEGYERVILAIAGPKSLVDRADAYLVAGVPLRDDA